MICQTQKSKKTGQILAMEVSRLCPYESQLKSRKALAARLGLLKAGELLANRVARGNVTRRDFDAMADFARAAVDGARAANKHTRDAMERAALGAIRNMGLAILSYYGARTHDGEIINAAPFEHVKIALEWIDKADNLARAA